MTDEYPGLEIDEVEDLGKCTDCDELRPLCVCPPQEVPC